MSTRRLLRSVCEGDERHAFALKRRTAAYRDDRRTTLERVYQPQCVRDETMGEVIAAAFETAPPRALVVHVNSTFHNDFHEGTASRALRRLRGKRLTVVSFQPVRDLDAADGALQRKVADYIVFTLAAPPSTSLKP